MVKYKITLTKEERDKLMSIINKGKHTSQKFRNAYVLLNCDEGDYSDKVTNAEINKILKVGMLLNGLRNHHQPWCSNSCFSY